MNHSGGSPLSISFRIGSAGWFLFVFCSVILRLSIFSVVFMLVLRVAAATSTASISSGAYFRRYFLSACSLRRLRRGAKDFFRIRNRWCVSIFCVI